MKGFTLVEMIAILIIFAIIATFAGFNIINVQKSLYEQEKEKRLETIYMATESYILGQNLTEYFKQENYAMFISINDLIVKGYIDSNILSEDLNINVESTVKVYLNDDSTYNYSFNSINIKNYISNGLIMYINGYNKNCEIGNYTLSNWKGNHFEFNNITYDISLNTPLTISAVYKIIDSSNNYVWKIYNNNDYNIATGYASGNLYVRNNSNTIYSNTSNQIGEVICETIVVNSNTIKRYINGELVYQQTYTGNILSSNKINFNKGELYNFLIYNKELSTNEINHNYLVDKGRYYENN